MNEQNNVDIEFIKRNITINLKDTPVVRAILFGSYAKGVADSMSDIDLVVDSQGKLKGFKFFGLLEKLTRSLGKTVDLIEMCEIDKDSDIYRKILKEGIIIYESAH